MAPAREYSKMRAEAQKEAAKEAAEAAVLKEFLARLQQLLAAWATPAIFPAAMVDGRQ